MEILDYINLAIDGQRDRDPPKGVERAKRAYELGSEYYGALDNIENLFDEVQFRRVPESTPTRKIITNSVPGLSMWARDPRSVKLIDGKRSTVIEGFPLEEPVSQRDLSLVENEIRDSIMPQRYDFFFTQLLITGSAIVSVGLEDDFFVPETQDIMFDADTDMWMTIERDILGDTMNRVVETWERAFEGEPMGEYEFNDEVRIRHGQVHIKHVKAYVEFIVHGEEIFYKVHQKPVMFRQVFTCDEDGDPMGVHEIIRNEEISIIKSQLAINSRINETITASAIVDGSVMNDSNADVNELFSSAILTVNGTGGSINNDAQQQPITFVPSRTAEIQVYRENIATLMETCYQMTGLHPRPVEFSAGNTSATEAVMVYKNTTLRMRQIIEAFSTIMGGIICARMYRDENIAADFDVSKNPLDFEERKVAIKESLPDLLGMVKEDPTGKMFGGIINARTVHLMTQELFEASGIPPSWLGDPGPNFLQDHKTMMNAQQREMSAEDKIAEAEMKKASGGIMRAKVAAANLVLANRKHNDEQMLGLLELLQKANETQDEDLRDKVASAIAAIGKNNDGIPEMDISGPMDEEEEE